MRRIYLITLFFSSFLLFLVQPMMAKSLLPLVGGSPAIWVSCMLFFQTILLAGYAYAAIGSAYLKPRPQLLLHILIMAVALFVALPVTIPQALGPQAPGMADNAPELAVLLVLFTTIGLPYFLLSASSSLLQRWFHEQFQASPYHLFAASNAGSLAGLFGYPLVMEWILPLYQQMAVWGAGFALLAALFMAVGYGLNKAQVEGRLASMGQNLPLRNIAYVVFLGFVPSSLFLSTTLYVTTDLVSFPMLWIMPLALYLLSFIVAFSARGEKFTALAQGRHIIAVMAIIATSLFISNAGLWVLHFVLFFIIALSCHGQAARMKPEPQRLTAFFFWLSVGGALGGLFNTAAPYIFNDIREHLIVLLLSVFALPRSHFSGVSLSALRGQNRMRAVAIALACVAFVWLGVQHLSNDRKDGEVIYVDRNFFGVSKVLRDGQFIKYIHGTTYHGVQAVAPEQKRQLTTYYGPIKTLIDDFPPAYFAKPFGIIGLGAGTQACYGRNGQAVEFFEIDQAVIDIAKNPDFFTYLRDCPPNISIFKGDGRLELVKRPDAYYHLLVMDAFTSDAVPLHLLTAEAVDLYVKKLVPETGMLAFHITNRHLSFKYVLSRIAESRHLEPYLLEHVGQQDNLFESPAHWLLMVPQKFPGKDVLLKHGFVRLAVPEHTPLWTDQYSNILPTFKW